LARLLFSVAPHFAFISRHYLRMCENAQQEKAFFVLLVHGRYFQVFAGGVFPLFLPQIYPLLPSST
jgi:hypothetical protein